MSVQVEKSYGSYLQMFLFAITFGPGKHPKAQVPEQQTAVNEI
jgi:hypothetical protein